MASIPSRVRFVEVQREGWTGRRICIFAGALYGWISFLLMVLIQRQALDFYALRGHLVALFFFGIVIPLSLLVGRVVLRVTLEGVQFRLMVGPLTLLRRHIESGDIRDAKVASCYPSIDAGCWGLGKGPEGVRVRRRDGDFTLIVTKRPEEMVAAIKTVTQADTNAPAAA